MQKKVFMCIAIICLKLLLQKNVDCAGSKIITNSATNFTRSGSVIAKKPNNALLKG